MTFDAESAGGGESKFGDGSDGSYTSGDNLEPGVEHQFTDFTLNSGDTLRSTASNSGEPIIIRVKGDVDISGTIDLQGQGYIGGEGLHSAIAKDTTFDSNQTTNFPASFGTPGSDAGVDTEGVIEGQGGIGYGAELAMSRLNKTVFAGTGGGSGAAETVGVDEEQKGGGGGSSYNNNGANGSGDFVDGEEGGTGTPGDGGACMIIFCSGNLSFTGTIDIRGEDGSAGDSAGSGGGGAGMMYILFGGSLTDSGTKLTSGGAGGNPSNTSATGGNGANGTIIFESAR